MKKKNPLGLRVLSTAAIMSIITSIAASAFAGTYYMNNGDVNVEVKENGDVYVNNQKDEDGEVIIKGGSGTNTWSNKKAEEQKAEEQQEETSIGESYPVEEEPEAEPAAEEPEEVESEQPEETGEEPETAETAEEEQPEPEGSEEAAEESEADEPAGETDPEENPDETDKEQDTEDAADETPVEEDAEPSGEAADEETAPAEQELAEEPAEEETTEPSEDETPAESPNTISIKNDWKTNLKIILDNVNIKVGGSKAALSVTGKGSTTIELDGDNVLDSSETSGNAGLEVGQDTTVTITDTDGTVDDRASLKATGGNGGAGIGGAVDGKKVGNIIIEGTADVTATGSEGRYEGASGIGTGGITSGNFPNSSVDSITIGGDAKVTATGVGNYASGIGGSYKGEVGDITITGNADVTATCKNGVGIGTGQTTGQWPEIRKDTTITINDHAKVDASGSTGIGSGTNGNQANYPLSGSIIIKDDAKVEYARGWNAIGFIDDYKYKTATSELKILGNATLEDLQGYYNGIGANNVTIGDDTGKVTIENLESSQYYYGPLIRANESLTIASNADITLTQPTQERNTTFIKAGVDADGNSIYLTKADLKKIIGEDGTGKITYRIKDKTTGEYTLQYVVHGKDGCIWVLDEDQSVASTCTTKGKVVYVCKLEDGAVNAACHYGDDGTNTRTIELELAEHTWDDGVITTDPTCTTAGEKTYTCAVCNGTKTEAVDALGHDYGEEWDEVTPATCTTAGKKVKHCKNAPDEESHDFVETIAVDPTNHVHIKVDGKQDATCGKPGYTGNTVCEDCNETIATGEDIPATGNHSWNEGKVTTPATCTTAGVKTYTCTVCHATKTEEIAPTGHNWGEWTTTKKATCTVDGVQERVCKNDPTHKETKKIDATGHAWVNDGAHVDATCTTDGYQDQKCTNDGCDATQRVWDHPEDTEHKGDGTSHDYKDQEWVITPATCTKDGQKVKHCTRAPEDPTHDEVEVIPATGHEKTHVEGKKEPTCEEPGYTGDKVCDKCGEVVEKGEVIHAKGHTPTVVGRKDPTETEPGYTGDTVCADCGKLLEKGHEIPATGKKDAENAEAPELRVVVPGSTLRELWFTVRQSGGERTYTCKQDNAILTGSLETLQYLQSQGADTIVFVTNGRVSRFAVADLLALCNEGDVFYLCHTADAEPTLLIIANDHTELLNS